MKTTIAMPYIYPQYTYRQYAAKARVVVHPMMHPRTPLRVGSVGHARGAKYAGWGHELSCTRARAEAGPRTGVPAYVGTWGCSIRRTS